MEHSSASIINCFSFEKKLVVDSDEEEEEIYVYKNIINGLFDYYNRPISGHDSDMQHRPPRPTTTT